MFILDTKKEDIAVTEANKLGIPIEEQKLLSNVAVDAVFGTGLVRPMEPAVWGALEMAHRGGRLVAVDLPSGLCSDSGRFLAAGEAKCTFGTGAFLLSATGASAPRSHAGLTTSVGARLRGETSYCLDGQVYTAGTLVPFTIQSVSKPYVYALALVPLAVPDGMGVGGVYTWVNRKAKQRMELLEEQLPDAIELMVRSLRVGHPFSSAIANVAKEIAESRRLCARRGWPVIDVTRRSIEETAAATSDLAEQALQLQPNLPEAHLAMGFSYYYGDNNYDAALEEFEIARRGLPNESEVYLAIGAIQRRQVRLGALAGRRVALEDARQRELAELVPDHVLGDVHRDMLLAVVHRHRQADEIGHHRRAARPGLDRALVAGRARGVHLLHQVVVDERTLLYRTCHVWLSLRRVPTAHDH